MSHAFSSFHSARSRDLTVLSRRNAFKVGLAGLAGLSVPRLMAARQEASKAGRPLGNKSVILLWMAGGPSQIDTWDPKPNRPDINRGPFGSIRTNVSGIHIGEHLPKQAKMMDRFTIIRSMNPRTSEHSPNKVWQTGHPDASPRRSQKGDLYPAMGSVVGKFRGANQPGLPPYVSFNRDPDHVAQGGYLGQQFNAMNGHQAAGLPEYQGFGRLTEEEKSFSREGGFDLPTGLSPLRLQQRGSLLKRLDAMRKSIDRSGAMEAADHFQAQALEMVLGGAARKAFDLSREPARTRERYGNQLWCQQALLARRLVEAGVSFVTIDLTMGMNAGDWDSHGDQHVFGGIETGLKPLLPIYDHLISTLVSDLEERGLLDDTLVLSLGDFGRDPIIGTQKGFSGGRNHWKRVMSMCLAGGGLRHGQVIGASDKTGGEIDERGITPQDLAATVYRHMGVPLDATYEDTSGRPIHVVPGSGQPIKELF